MFLEFISVIIVGLLVFILIKLNKKEEIKKDDNYLANELLLNQLKNIEKTLDTKTKEDIDRQQKVMKCVEENIGNFTRTINGTKRRGKVGEIILKQILAEPISAGLITTDLKMDNGTVVEFAWDLKNGKFLPMDSKLPELEDLLNEFDLSEDPSEQAKIKKNILKIIDKSKSEAKKYINNHNTIDKCIVAVPDTIIDLFPDINKESNKSGIFVAGYTKVFLFAYMIGESYNKSLALGNIGVYKETINSLRNILGNIEKKTDTINKGLTQISNANKEISSEVDRSVSKIGQISFLESAEEGKKRLN